MEEKQEVGAEWQGCEVKACASDLTFGLTFDLTFGVTSVLM